MHHALLLSSRHLGNRFSSFSSRRRMWEGLLQNGLLLLNGALAVVFAVEWQGDNNPLLVVQVRKDVMADLPKFHIPSFIP